MAQQIDHGDRKPLLKPTKKPKNQGKSKWQATRKLYLKDKLLHGGYYTCFECGIHTQNPEVDHIEKRSLRPDLVYEFSNLRVLCSRCHRERHNQ